MAASTDITLRKWKNRILSLADVSENFVNNLDDDNFTNICNDTQYELYRLLFNIYGEDMIQTYADLLIPAGDGFYEWGSNYRINLPFALLRVDYVDAVSTSTPNYSAISYSDEASGEPLLELWPDYGVEPIGTIGTAHLLPASGTYTITLEAEIANPNGSASDVSIWYSTTSGDDFSGVSLLDPECQTVSVGAGTTDTHEYTWTITYDGSTSTSYLGFGAFCGDSGLSINSVTLTISGTYLSSTTTTYSPGTGVRYPMSRYDLAGKTLDDTPKSWGQSYVEYDFRPPRLYFYPKNADPKYVRIYYVAKPAILTSDDGYVEWITQEHIELATIMAAQHIMCKDEQAMTELNVIYQTYLDRIKRMPPRDHANPKHVIDKQSRNQFRFDAEDELWLRGF